MTSLFEEVATASGVVAMEFSEWADDALESPAVHEPVALSTEIERAEAAVRAERDAWWQAQMEKQQEQAFEDGRASAEKHHRESLEIERSAISLACTGFGRAREKYFAEIEAEVVKLALAISSRVLQREVKMDPVLLMGVVRVALEKLSGDDGAVLEVPAKNADVWKRAMKHPGVTVNADESLEDGEIVLKTVSGTAELGVEAQLVEIERGFFDLLAKRPA